MESYKTVIISRTYKISDAEIEVKQSSNESIKDTAKRIAIQTMNEELRIGLLEAGEEDFSIKVI